MSRDSENVDNEAKKDFVDRWFEIENNFNTAKVERNDLVKDMKIEIKSRIEKTGVDAKEVARLVKIRIDELAAKETAAQNAADILIYEILYGASADGPIDPLA